MDLNQEDVRQLLGELTDREREILQLRCDSLSYREIGERLVIAEGTVKAHMGNIYRKLRLDTLSYAQRLEALFTLYCPVLGEGDLPANSASDAEPEPLSDEILTMVTVDEQALASRPPHEPGTPRRVIAIPSEPEARARLPRWLLVTLLFAGIFLLGFLSAMRLTGSEASPAVTVTATAAAVTENDVQERRSTPPTDVNNVTPTVPAEVVVEDTPEPTATPQPTNTPAATKVPTPLPDTASGTILRRGDEWRHGDLGITFVDYSQGGMQWISNWTDRGDCVLLELHNYADHKQYLDDSTTFSDFYLEDPQGTQHRFNAFRFGTEGRFSYSFDLTSLEPEQTTEVTLCVVPKVVDHERWEFFRIGIRYLLGVRDAVWQEDIRASVPTPAPQPTATPLVNAQPGESLLLPHKEWYQDGLGITLVHYRQRGIQWYNNWTNRGDCMLLLLRNYTEEKLYLDDTVTFADFYIEGPDGEQHRFNGYREGPDGRLSDRFELTSIEPLQAKEILICVVAPVVDPELWPSFVFGIKKFLSIEDARWQIDLR